MEKPEGSIDLYEFSQVYGSMKEDAARIIFEQVVRICCELENINIFHRDIKDENVLINIDTLQAKLIDFGCSVSSDTEKVFNSFSGTPEFAAPEVKLGVEYTSGPATVWTLGMLLYILLIGDVPFVNDQDAMRGLRRKVTFILG